MPLRDARPESPVGPATKASTRLEVESRLTVAYSGRLCQVPDRRDENLSAVLPSTNHSVTESAKQTSNSVCLVAVVNMKLASSFRRIRTTNGAPSALLSKHPIEVCKANSISALKLTIAHPVFILRVILARFRYELFRICCVFGLVSFSKFFFVFCSVFATSCIQFVTMLRSIRPLVCS